MTSVPSNAFKNVYKSKVNFKLFTNEASKCYTATPVDESEVTDASFCSEDGSVESPSSAWSSSTVITENPKEQRRRLVEGPPDSKMAKDVSCVKGGNRQLKSTTRPKVSLIKQEGNLSTF